MTRAVALMVAAAVLLLWTLPAPPLVPADTDDGLAVAHTLTPSSSSANETNRSRGAELRTVEDAVIVNANADRVPPGCDEITGERNVTVRAGRRYAEAGEMFGYDTDRIAVTPCTRLTVTLINEDRVRHQWMVHGLPREIYPMGMFSIELTGPGKATGTFIVPSGGRRLRVHCSLPQHEQKGMRATLVVGDRERRTTGESRDEMAGALPGFGVLTGVVAFALIARRYAGS